VYLTTTSAPKVATRAHETAAPPGADLPVWLVIGGGVAVIGFALFLVRRYRNDARAARRVER
jgi:hypothetical protein